MHRKEHLAAYRQRRCKQEVERTPDRAVRGVLHGYHAVADLAGLHFAKHLVDGPARARAHLSTEMLERSFFAEGSARAQKSHRQSLLERAARRDQLGEQM